LYFYKLNSIIFISEVLKTAYKYFEKEQFLIMVFFDYFSINDYKKAVQTMQKQKFWQDIKYFLLDLREIKIDKPKLINEELIQIRHHLKSSNYKIAYLIENPTILANIILYLESVKSINYQCFSTIKSAMNHLDLKLSESEIENRIQNLK